MAFIQIEFGGGKTAGGFLSIDGGKRIKLKDGKIIPVSAGVHYLSFSNKSKADRAISTANALEGNAKMAYMLEKDAVDGDITIELADNDMMFFTVISNNAGTVVSLPTYSVRELDDEELQTATDICIKQQAAAKRKGKRKWGIIVALLGVVAAFQNGVDTTTRIVGICMIIAGILLFLWGTGLLSKKSKK